MVNGANSGNKLVSQLALVLFIIANTIKTHKTFYRSVAFA